MKDLMHRIAEFFREWNGSTPAPLMQVHIDDLRLIAQMNSELCALREEKRNGRWIPCSERLPNETGCYRVTYKYRDEEPRIGFCDYYTGEGKFYVYGKAGWYSEGYPADDSVTAWIEQPIPYKGEIQNEEINEKK